MIGFLKSRKHTKTRDLLSAYLDGEVSDAESRRVEDHLEGCSECRLELETLKSTVGLLRQLPELEIARSFALIETPAEVRATRSIVWVARLATPVAAVLLVALLLGDVLGVVTQTGEIEKVGVVAQESLPVPQAAVAPAASPLPGVAERAAPAAAAAPVPVPAPAAALQAPPPETSVEATVAERATEDEAAIQQAVPGAAESAATVLPFRQKQVQTPPQAAQAAAVPVASAAERMVTDVSEGVALPLWQLEVGLAALAASLALATLWTWRREKRL